MHIKMYKSVTIINKCATTDEMCILFHILLAFDFGQVALHFKGK